MRLKCAIEADARINDLAEHVTPNLDPDREGDPAVGRGLPCVTAGGGEAEAEIEVPVGRTATTQLAVEADGVSARIERVVEIASDGLIQRTGNQKAMVSICH